MDLRPWPELQELLPPLSTQQQAALRRSLQRGKVDAPIFHLPDGRIIDGHHRWELSDHSYPYLKEVDISEDDAKLLGLALNIARRQLGLKQLEQLHRELEKAEALKKNLAHELREQGYTQAEAAAIVGVARQTLSDWENMPNAESGNGHIPDCRVSIPKEEREAIYRRHVERDETQRQIAADYQVHQSTISKIVRQVQSSLNTAPQLELVTNGIEIELYNEDALYRLPLIEDGSIALAVVDPPYNVTDNEWDKVGTPDEYLAWLGEWLGLLRPKLRQEYHLFLFCSPEYQADIELLLRRNDWPLKSRIIWEHRNLVKGRDVTDRYICDWEMVFHCGTHPLNLPLAWDDTRFEVKQYARPQSNFKDKSYHPTAKPLALIELFVQHGSKAGDMVLDPFAGGGTTGEACQQMGQRSCILIEQNSDYCTTIESRLGIARIKANGRDH